jgi:hypothetical protein
MILSNFIPVHLCPFAVKLFALFASIRVHSRLTVYRGRLRAASGPPYEHLAVTNEIGRPNRIWIRGDQFSSFEHKFSAEPAAGGVINLVP